MYEPVKHAHCEGKSICDNDGERHVPERTGNLRPLTDDLTMNRGMESLDRAWIQGRVRLLGRLR